jgi:hypothetical protein
MRIFYTENDIEDMVARGVRQLEVGPGVILTDAARQHAEGLGLVLVKPGSAPAGNAALVAPAQGGVLPARPRGCQHGPVSTASPRREVAGGGGPVVDQLVAAVSALKKRGG